MDVVLITGNKNKAKYFSKYMEINIEQIDLNLEEIQSLDLKEIIAHKAKQAHEQVGRPVIVEDVALEFKTLGKLPGPFIKFFLQELTMEEICDLLKNKSRAALARCIIGYYDGKDMQLFEGELSGTISTEPRGDREFGWDKIFIPDGYEVTRSEMNDEDYKKTYLQIRRLDLLKNHINAKSKE